MRTLAKAAAVIFDRVIDIFSVLSASVILFLMLWVTLDVILRDLFNRPIAGTIEIAEYSLLFITFFAATWVLRKEGHVAIDVMVERLRPRTQALFGIITSIVCVIASLVLAWFGFRVVWQYFSENIRFTTQLMPPAYPIIGVVPVVFLMLFIQFLRRAHRFWKTYTLKEESAGETQKES